MRAGEFTCPSREAFTPNVLTASVDSHLRPTRLAIHLRESKTDQFGIGAMLHLGATGDDLCPVALLGYLAVRPSLFVFEDGASLSRERLVQVLRLVLHSSGIDSTRFSGHSFRIGAATAVANAGLGDSMTQTLGSRPLLMDTFRLFGSVPRQCLHAWQAQTRESLSRPRIQDSIWPVGIIVL